MKATLQALLIVAVVFSSRAADSPATDGWSETVNGLRARIVFGKGHVSNGTRVPEVYLELYNATDVGNPMEFDFDLRKSLHFDLRTAEGKPAPLPLLGADGFIFGTFHITLPRDGTLKFPVTWYGHLIPRDGGTAFGFEGAFWVIPASDANDYFLSVTLDISEASRDSEKPYCWHGTIKIPSVKAPTKKK